MNKLEFSVNETKTLNFQFLFSYVIVKKILFYSDNENDISISSLIRYNPEITIESTTNKGSVIKTNFYLPTYFTPFSINSIIDLPNNELIIPEYNFKNTLLANEFVDKSDIIFSCNNNNIKLYLSIDVTPGVTEQTKK